MALANTPQLSHIVCHNLDALSLQDASAMIGVRPNSDKLISTKQYLHAYKQTAAGL